jgi:glycosyltransferase involved in cell wall biosynthesis
LVIDDGSAEGGRINQTVLAPYLSLPNVTYVYQENRGPGAAVNRGLELARGEYIQRLDDDDRLLPEKIARCVEIFKANPDVGLVATGHYMIDREGRRYQQGTPRSNRLFDIIITGLSKQATVMARSCVHQTVGLYRNDIIGEDYEMWIRVAKAYRVMTIDEPLAEYRRHPGNATRDSNALQMEKDMVGFIVEQLQTTPVEVLVPGLKFEAYGYALRAAAYLHRSRPYWRTIDYAKKDLELALRLAPDNPILSLWKGIMANCGEEDFRPFPWEDESLPADYRPEAERLGRIFRLKKEFSAAKVGPSAPEVVALRREFREALIGLTRETYRRAAPE